MKIPLTNDDGIHAQGTCELVETLVQIATVAVVTPMKSRSGVSSQITSRTSLRITLMGESEQLPYQLHSCSGMLVDCVKLILGTVFTTMLPNPMVSGISHRYNDGICVTYSGMAGAAIGVATARILAIAFSLADHSGKCGFSEVCVFAK